MEPYLPITSKCARLCLSGATVLFWVSIWYQTIYILHSIYFLSCLFTFCSTSCDPWSTANFRKPLKLNLNINTCMFHFLYRPETVQQSQFLLWIILCIVFNQPGSGSCGHNITSARSIMHPNCICACVWACALTVVSELCELLYLSLSSRCCCVSVLKISLIIACIIGVIAYRLAVYAAFASIMKDSPTTHLQVVGPLITPQLATSVTASCINFVIIMILNLMYERVAVWITDMGEGHRANIIGSSRLPWTVFFKNLFNCFYVL